MRNTTGPDGGIGPQVRDLKVSATRVVGQVRVGVDPRKPWEEMWLDVEIRRGPRKGDPHGVEAALKPLETYLIDQAEAAMRRVRGEP